MDVLRVRLNLVTIAAFRSEFVEENTRRRFWLKISYAKRYKILFPRRTAPRWDTFESFLKFLLKAQPTAFVMFFVILLYTGIVNA